jgi:hypothetical protein
MKNSWNKLFNKSLFNYHFSRKTWTFVNGVKVFWKRKTFFDDPFHRNWWFSLWIGLKNTLFLKEKHWLKVSYDFLITHYWERWKQKLEGKDEKLLPEEWARSEGWRWERVKVLRFFGWEYKEKKQNTKLRKLHLSQSNIN